MITNESVPYVQSRDVDLSRLYIESQAYWNSFVIITKISL